MRVIRYIFHGQKFCSQDILGISTLIIYFLKKLSQIVVNVNFILVI